MDIKEYMQRVYTLEKNSFEQKALISQIKEQLEQAKHPKFYSQKEVTPPSNGVASTFFQLFYVQGLGPL